MKTKNNYSIHINILGVNDMLKCIAGKLKEQHTNKHASPEILIYLMNITKHRGQPFKYQTIYSTNTLLTRRKHLQTDCIDDSALLNQFYYHIELAKIGIRIPIVWLMTRRHINQLNYLHGTYHMYSQ
ncbi:hypothetical protein CIPAW_01G089400 [Carya illinoinensis]|uniref:Uncharacterized protein n=1 Tax=Carya illinoinensis TaxID=32201 RepID=A0A8T1RIN8_CARIL|nr:hypothetical protein CIPAW_01G089400 [Carya illinoinensis]